MRLLLFVCFLSSSVFAADYYLSPDGSDGNDGSFEKPFFSVNKANDKAMAGDRVFIRGGTYKITTEHVKRYRKIWAYVTSFSNFNPFSHIIVILIEV